MRHWIPVGLALLVACKPTPGDTDTDSVIAPTPPAFGSLEWADCGLSMSPEAQCASLDVPIDHADAAVGNTRIDLVHLPATDPDPLGHLWVNFGGPGASFSSANAAFVLDQWASPTVRARYHLSTWTPRGAPDSWHPLECPGAPAFTDVDRTPDSEAEWAALAESSAAFAEACTGSPLLGWTGPMDHARDLEWLRIANGEEQLNLLGISYGSLYGLSYADAFPETVGRLVLDSPMAGSLTFSDWTTDTGVAQWALLSAGLDACAVDSECVFGAGDPHGALEDLLASLDATPLSTPSGPVDDSGLLLALASVPFEVSTEAAYRGRMTGLLDQVEQGQTPLLNAVLGASPFTPAATRSMLCDHDSHPADGQAFMESSDGDVPVGSVIASLVVHCADWPAASRRSAAPISGEGAGPILLIAGEADVATPKIWADRLLTELDDAALVTGPRWGHGQYRRGAEACLHEAVDTYLLDGVLPSSSKVCP